MYKESKIYFTMLGIIGFLEVVTAIPFLLDSIMGESLGTNIVMILFVSHIFAYMFVNTGLVEYYSKVTHFLGIIASLMSFLPLIGFIPHIVVAVKVIFDFKDLSKRYKKDLELRVEKEELEQEDFDMY